MGGKRATNPDQPWLVNRAWADGKVKDGSTTAVVFMWVFALFWNAVSWPIALLVPAEKGGTDGNAVWLVMIFPIIGIALLIPAVYLTLQRLKFGRSVLELETLPGCVGGWLAGTIRTSVPLRAEQGIQLLLRCVQQTSTGSGKNRRTSTDTLWEDLQVLGPGRGDAVGAGDGSDAIPVAFRIPRGCRATSVGKNSRIEWRLQVRAATRGADYAAHFSVPVYAAKQPAGLVPLAEKAAAARRERAPQTLGMADDPRIHYEASAAGGKRFDIPGGRNPFATAFISTFGVLMAGGAYLTWIKSAPIVFPICCTAVALLCFVGAMVVAFRARTIRVDRQGLRLQWRMLGFSGEREIVAAEVRSVQAERTSQMGETPYFTVYVTAPGHKHAAASGLRSRDAEWIVREIEQTLGRKQPVREMA